MSLCPVSCVFVLCLACIRLYMHLFVCVRLHVIYMYSMYLSFMYMSVSTRLKCTNFFILYHIWRRTFGESKLTFKTVERNARRYKNRYPKMPKNATDIIKAFNDNEIVKKYAFNLRRTKRFYIDTVVNGAGFFTIFASHQIISLIEKFIKPEERKYLVDGTFKIVPLNSYYQLLIIHIEYKNDVNNV